MPIGKKAVPRVEVELPEYFKYIFTTTEENEQLHVGYYSLSPSNLQDIILDGVHDKTLATNGPDAYITVPTPGRHVLYIYEVTPWQNTNYAWHLRGNNIEYIRIPYNYQGGLRVGRGNGSLAVQKIDILKYHLYPGNGYPWEYSSLGDIRVPPGSLEYYKTTIGSNKATWYSEKTNSLTEANFIYEES